MSKKQQETALSRCRGRPPGSSNDGVRDRHDAGEAGALGTTTGESRRRKGRNGRPTAPPLARANARGDRGIATSRGGEKNTSDSKAKLSSPQRLELGLRRYYDADDDDDAPPRKKPLKDEFVGSELQDRQAGRGRGVFVPEWVFQVTANGDERLVLAQIAYWFGPSPNGRPRARIRQKGYLWLAKTYKELGGEVSLSERQVRHVLDKLDAKNLLVREVHMFRGRRASYLRLRPDVILEQIQENRVTKRNVEDDEMY